ncbi:glycoside hydrolase family 16 protein [Vibrio maritimus]|uniref:glycoside hydrolase family 16 protein n=1 Tax=Vibrio maritimus TaxID=990268 RepID=UPI001F1B43D3|nr:glycoside hydrolase family 16 protein [Vibrio maritimus]
MTTWFRRLGLLIIGVFTVPVLAGWQVHWIDTFEGNSVNWNNWTAQTQANYNNEVQCYTDDDSSEQRNYDVSDGTLKIIARKGTNQCMTLSGQTKTWTSGRINTKDKQEFLYGRLEARIRFHNLEGGTWPAFWMLENRIAEQPIKGDNDNVGWPNVGASEIDVWEWFSNEPESYITNFFNTAHSCGSEYRYTYPNGAQDVLDWHRYAMEWDENEIAFYIDDELVTRHDVSQCPRYKEPMFVLLNVAMGGMLGGNIDPSLQQATMEVDYIAHCQRSASNDIQYCDEDTPIADPNETIPERPSAGVDSTSNGGAQSLWTLLALLTIAAIKKRKPNTRK